VFFTEVLSRNCPAGLEQAHRNPALDVCSTFSHQQRQSFSSLLRGSERRWLTWQRSRLRRGRVRSAERSSWGRCCNTFRKGSFSSRRKKFGTAARKGTSKSSSTVWSKEEHFVASGCDEMVERPCQGAKGNRSQEAQVENENWLG